MFAPFKYLITLSFLFLVFCAVFPVLVTALYGGKAPPQIAQHLEKHTETLSKIAPMLYSTFKGFGWFDEKQSDKK